MRLFHESMGIGTRLVAAAALVVSAGCATESPTTPSSGPVTVGFDVRIVRPSSVAGIAALPATVRLATRAQGAVEVSGGSATLTLACTAQIGGSTPVPVTGLNSAFNNRTVMDGSPVTFDEVLPIELGFPQTNLDGTVTCNLTGTTSTGETVSETREATFTSNEFLPRPSSCTPDDQTMCVLSGRFRVVVDWRTADGQIGNGTVQAGQRFDDGGSFYFFSPESAELFIQVLDGCAINDRFWVFFAATTNVEFTVDIVDTANGAARQYFKPLDQTFEPIQDTSAFATCP